MRLMRSKLGRGGESSSVFCWYSLVALRVAGVQARLELPCLTASLSVSKELEQGDDADPEVECDAGLQLKVLFRAMIIHASIHDSTKSMHLLLMS